MSIIDSIQLSGVTYQIQGSGGGGNPTVELTQAEYDALVTAGTVSADTFYVITDAQAGDLTNYYTKTETNTLLDDKADTATTYTKTEVDNAITGATSTKQDTLVSGTNIKTINNTSLLGSGNIDIQGGGGGGKAIEAGRGIAITTGETADTVSFSLPISAGTGNYSIIEGYIENKATGHYSHAEGQKTSATTFYAHAEGANSLANGNSSHAEGQSTIANGNASHAEGYKTTVYGDYNHAEGYYTVASGLTGSYQQTSSHAEGAFTSALTDASHAEGRRTFTSNKSEHASGQYNNSVSGSSTFGDSGNTLFSVGNGTGENARHNAFEIRQNGDIYLSSGSTDIKLQDHLGGGGGGGISSAECQTMIDENISGKTDNTTFTAYTASTDTAIQGKQDTLVSGTNIKTINNESLLGSGNIDIQGGGGGKAIEAGRGITITTGATADTVSFNLPISAGTGTNSLILGYNNSGDSYWNSKASGQGAIACGVKCTASGQECVAIGYNNTASGGYAASNFAQGYMTTASGNRCHSEGLQTSSTADASHSEGNNTTASGNYSHSEGEGVKATNVAEHSQGRYNVSNKANTTFGDSGNTLFSVGNGTAENARHNAFEIRQNGDIYLSSGGTDIKLQDHLGGGGASYSAGTGIDITNNVISVSGVVETSAITTAITSSSTDAQVPSAKAVYDIVGDIETLLSQI